MGKKEETKRRRMRNRDVKKKGKKKGCRGCSIQWLSARRGGGRGHERQPGLPVCVCRAADRPQCG